MREDRELEGFEIVHKKEECMKMMGCYSLMEGAKVLGWLNIKFMRSFAWEANGWLI